MQIGELVGVLSDEFKKEHGSIPWAQIKKMRNIVAHRYGTVDATITWDVMKEDIPDLKSYCIALYTEQETDSSEEVSDNCENNSYHKNV